MSDPVLTSRNLTVAATQFEPHIGDRAFNLAAIDRMVRRAASEGADLVVLPELANTGYLFQSTTELATLAESVPDGTSVRFLASLSRDLAIHIVCGLAERDGDSFYNAAILTGPEGYLGKYRKLHLWNDENRYFAPGNLGLPVFDIGIGKVGIAICYDGWFPEVFRQLALSGAELICVPTNWVPMPGSESRDDTMSNILTKAAAHSNGVHIVCADRIGTERGQPFIGRSLIVGPDGWPLAGPASADREEVLLAVIDLSSVPQSRILNSFNHLLGDRRTDVYR
ncbi:nitrilase family protein [Allorhizobium taibaishanense]|uniref:Hydratase n=1 Tax=Allorhizobium taibaishanense TaxID=887144 RepID=A0A1Q9A063_9HYPH|nr:nitrilase family protein [Allorhizobium taibaishanense]MBB4010545.1 putative amidohydrolase [Allorhizobium taibaishanense]OLP47919.1 hydratase [Allorhizobium taibaishanense]